MEDCETLEDLVALYNQHCCCQLIYYIARLSDCQTITEDDSRDVFVLQMIKEYDQYNEVCKDIRQPCRSE